MDAIGWVSSILVGIVVGIVTRWLWRAFKAGKQ